MFKTERLTLRAYTSADLPSILTMANNPLVQRTLISDFVVPRSERFAIKLEEIANGALMYVVIELEGKLIGAASLITESVKNRDIALGIGIVPEHWNKGYGAEVSRFLVDHAFKNLGVHRVTLAVFANNQGAYEMYKKIGFVEEGRRRKSNWLDGQWHDSIFMGILEEEWLNPSTEK